MKEIPTLSVICYLIYHKRSEQNMDNANTFPLEVVSIRLFAEDRVFQVKETMEISFIPFLRK